MSTEAERQIVEFLSKYSSFNIARKDIKGIELVGAYVMDAQYNGVRLTDDFLLRIMVPVDYPKAVPLVFEDSRRIPNGYEHTFQDGHLCLGVEGELVLGLENDPSLIDFFRGPVIACLYAYIFFDRYGRYPFGDRKHGAEGILQFYEEFFDVKSSISAYKLLSYAIEKPPSKQKGHLLCPCGSGLRTRNCHGRSLAKLSSGPARKAARADLLAINKEIYWRQRQDELKSKWQTNCRLVAERTIRASSSRNPN